MNRSDRRRRMSAVQGRTTSRSWPNCSSARKAHPIHGDNSVAGSKARRRGNGGGCVVEVEAIITHRVSGFIVTGQPSRREHTSPGISLGV